MNPFDAPVLHPVLFWITASLLSLYHAVRAVLRQRRWVADENAARRNANPALGTWSLGDRVVIYYAHDFLFHVVCCMSGFVAAWTFAKLFKSIPDPANISAGTAILMTFLAVVSVAGVAGVLPPLLMKGRLGKGIATD